MKKYIAPAISISMLYTQPILQAASGGVQTGNKTGNEYDPDATTYGKRGYSIWQDDEEI